MKNIIFVSYSFGDNIPVGVGALRIAKAMIKLGWKLFVITSTDYHSNDSNLIIQKVENFPRLPSRVSFNLSNILQKELYYYSWEKKAKIVIKNIIKNNQIQGVYTRATPICVCTIGVFAKKHFRLPLIMHFTDPIPAPKEWSPNPMYRSRMTKQMKEYIEYADYVSFGNERMLSYQEDILLTSLKNRAFVSPDPSKNSFIMLPESNKKSNELTLVYLGNIYGNRNPYNLFEALRLFSNRSCHFIIYGSRFNGTPDFIEFRKRTTDVSNALKEADILVDIDGDDKTPVFISSKLKDYLSVNRPILSITPLNSPTRELLANLKTIEIANNTIEDIKNSLVRLANERFYGEDYNERIVVLEKFSAPKIAKGIMDRMDSLCK